jgi:hypothetical protein
VAHPPDESAHGLPEGYSIPCKLPIASVGDGYVPLAATSDSRNAEYPSSKPLGPGSERTLGQNPPATFEGAETVQEIFV